MGDRPPAVEPPSPPSRTGAPSQTVFSFATLRRKACPPRPRATAALPVRSQPPRREERSLQSGVTDGRCNTTWMASTHKWRKGCSACPTRARTDTPDRGGVPTFGSGARSRTGRLPNFSPTRPHTVRVAPRRPPINAPTSTKMGKAARLRSLVLQGRQCRCR